MKFFKKLFNNSLSIIFILILITPTINSITGIMKFERKEENRNFKNNLEIDIRHLDKFPKEFNTYINDNFSFRTPMLEIYHYIKFSSFKISPHPDKTIIGENDWFFMDGKEIDIYEGKWDFSEKKLEKYKKEWNRRKKYLDSKNIKFYWIIAPFKHYIYPEHLPFYFYKSKKERRAIQLKKYLKDDFDDFIIDPVPELLKHKNKKLFYKLDNHWNFNSGKIAAELLINKIKKDFPEKNIPDIPIYKWDTMTIQKGFHYNVMAIESLKELNEFPIIENINSIKTKNYGFPCIKGFAYPWDYEKRFKNDSINNGLKILFIRDSFGKQILPFIRESFEESLLIFDAWRYKLNEPIITKFKPDIIVFLGLETHLEAIISDKKH